MVRVLKQKIWVDAVSYELQEIYGIEQCSSTATGSAADEQGKECVICLSEPRDTTGACRAPPLPCRKILRSLTCCALPPPPPPGGGVGPWGGGR